MRCEVCCETPARVLVKLFLSAVQCRSTGTFTEDRFEPLVVIGQVFWVVDIFLLAKNLDNAATHGAQRPAVENWKRQCLSTLPV